MRLFGLAPRDPRTVASKVGGVLSVRVAATVAALVIGGTSVVATAAESFRDEPSRGRPAGAAAALTTLPTEGGARESTHSSELSRRPAPTGTRSSGLSSRSGAGGDSGLTRPDSAAASAASRGLTNGKSVPLSSAPSSGAAVAFPVTPGQLRAAQPQGLPDAPRLDLGETIAGAPGVPPAATGAGEAAQVVAAIQRYFPAQEWERAGAVARCESGMRSVVSPPNRNGSVDFGIFQLNDGGTLQGLLVEDGYPADRVDLALNLEWNVRAAARLWSQRGWQPWTCAKTLGFV